MIDKDVFAQMNKSAKVGIKGREYHGRLIYGFADDISKRGPYDLDVAGLVEFADKGKGPVYYLIDLKILRIVQSDWLAAFQSFKNIL